MIPWSPPTPSCLVPRRMDLGSDLAWLQRSLLPRKALTLDICTQLCCWWDLSPLLQRDLDSAEVGTGWRDELGQSMGKIHEKFLFSSPLLGLIPPPTVQEHSLLSRNISTMEQLQGKPRTQSIGVRLRVQVMGNIQKIWEWRWEKAWSRWLGQEGKVRWGELDLTVAGCGEWICLLVGMT